MEEKQSIFRKFSTLEQANDLKELLEKNGIEVVLADNVAPYDVTFSGNKLHDEIEVRLKLSDFKKAQEILVKNAEVLIDQIDKDYYLFTFENEELFDILLKPDEWSSLDYSLAKKILTQRGKSIDEDLLKSLKNERIKNLAKPEGSQRTWIMAGYLFVLLGGLIGILIGYSLKTSKKTLPNGEKVYSYSENDRKHGKYIFYLGLIVAPLMILLRFLADY